jgi:putative transposase
VDTYQAYKVRIYPTQLQADMIMQFIGNSRFVYNQMLAMQADRYKNGGRYVGYMAMSNLVKPLKQEYAFLKLSPSQSLQQACADLNAAFQNFFAKRADYPRFHSRKGAKQSMRVMQACSIIASGVKLPKLGIMRFRYGYSLDPSLKIRQVTVSYTSSHKFYASILVKCEKQALSKTGEQVGLDMGVADLAIQSNGKKIPTQKHDELEHSLHIWQRKLARRRELAKAEIAKSKHYDHTELTLDDFSNYNKAKIMVAKLHEKIANRRKDYLHKTTTKLVREYDLIAMEDLRTKNMVKNHHLAKSITNQGWNMFKTMLQYKCEWYGKTIVVVNPRNTSRVCSDCGVDSGKKPLDVREWTCPGCGTWHDRDVNAAQNILKLAV